MIKKNITKDTATFLSCLVSGVLFTLIFLVVFSWSLSVWNHHVEKARHNKHWHKEYVMVEKEGIVDNLTPPVHPAYVAYRYRGQIKWANRDLPIRFKVGDQLLAYVNNKGRLWVKSAEHQWTDTLDGTNRGNPFDISKEGGPWFPTLNDIVLGGVVNALLSIFLGIVFFALLLEEDQYLKRYSIYYPSPKKLYRKLRPEPPPPTYRTYTVLVHTPDGSLSTKEVREKV